MDFLFDNPLANLYGPYFLIVYISFIVCTIIGYRVMRSRIFYTEQFAIPPVPIDPDPFEIAYLRGGTNELARAVVFSLNQKNLVKFASDDKTSHIFPTGDEFDKRSLKPIERTTLEWFGTKRETKDLFSTKDGLIARLKPFAETFHSRLEMQNLIPDDEMIKRNTRLTQKAFLVFASLGAYKFAAAIYNGYWNVFGIIVVTFIGLVILAVAARMPRLTELGKTYLERLQLAFERIKPSNHHPLAAQYTSSSANFAAVDPFLLSVGVFGGAALAGTVYSDYNQAFQRAQNQSAAGSGSSCGSSCGSSSCSSGGDGGCGGGGCGGCG